MTLARALALSVLALACCLARPEPAAACGCLRGGPSDDYASASAVFVGRVVELERRENQKPPEHWPKEYPYVETWARIHVEEVFKGVEGETVLVFTGSSTSCDAHLEPGERYLVFARRSEKDGSLSTDNCSGTAPAHVAAPALLYARRTARGMTTSVVGFVREESPAGHLITRPLAEPVAGARVVLANEHGRYEAVTDAEGVFFFEGVPAGSYALRYELPKGLRLTYSHALGRADEPGAGTIAVSSDATPLEYATVTRGGLLLGRVVDESGSPMAGVMVMVVRREEAADPQPLRAVDYEQTDELGQFSFDPIPDGEYALVVNAFGAMAYDRVPYPRFYAPGVTDPAQAATIRIAGGSRLMLGDLRSPGPLPFQTLEVTVVDALDRPVRATVRCKRAGEDWGPSVLADESGRVTLIVPRGCTYEVSAHARDGQNALRTNVAIVEAVGGEGRVRLVAGPER